MKKITLICLLTLTLGVFLRPTAFALTINVVDTFASTASWTLIDGNSNDWGLNNGYMFLNDDNDAAVRTRVDTTGYNSIVLNYDWRMANAGDDDSLRVRYLVSSSIPDDWDDFYSPSLTSIDGDVTSWRDVNIPLASAAGNTPNLWIAYRLSGNDNDDEGRIDNVLVSGNRIGGGTPGATPEPASLSLLGLGLLGLFRIRRKV